MGAARRWGIALGLSGALLLAGTIVGCQMTPGASTEQFIVHRSLLDFAGLKPVEALSHLKVAFAPPANWDRLRVQKNLLYTHQQWRSPSHSTGVGVAYVRLPLPVSATTLVWFAKQEYSKQQSGGRLLSEWTDNLGRCWFEAENQKYHVRGYALCRGRDAWLVYCGYKVKAEPEPAELGLAARALDAVVPDGGE
jgi:hypothetical protein